MNVEFRHFRAFAAVVANRSYTLAATELALSQSALSRCITQLEARLGERLLVRDAHRVVLTERGRDFLVHTQTVLTAIDQAFTRPRPVTIRIGYGWLLPQPWARHIAELVAADGTASAAYIRCADPVAALRRNEIDAAILRTLHRGRTLRATPLFDERLAVLCSARKAATSPPDGLHSCDLRNWPLAIYSRGDITETGAWRRGEDPPGTILDAPTFDAWIATLVDDRAVALVPDSVRTHDLHPGLRTVALAAPAHAPTYLTYLRSSRSTALEHLRAVAEPDT